jgi:hypothetical protein
MTVLDTYLSTGAASGITLNAKKTVVILPHFTEINPELPGEVTAVEQHPGEPTGLPCGI